MFNPTKGKNGVKRINTYYNEFWNSVGRTGRLGKDFEGKDVKKKSIHSNKIRLSGAFFIASLIN